MLNAESLSLPRRTLDRLQAAIKLHQYNVRLFQPKIRLRIETPNLTLETAETPRDLEALARFRYEIFFKEGLGHTQEGVDIDRFDVNADHFIVTDNKSGKIVGTYRLISSDFSKEFYSQTEFLCAELMRATPKKLELGRACIRKEFRTGPVIQLLWRGIAAFIDKLEPELIFGCASVHTVEPKEVKRIAQYLRANNWHPDIFSLPKTHLRFPGFNYKFLENNLQLLHSEDTQAKLELPPLMRTYLSAGAKICGGPMIDKEFQCVDFLVALKVADISMGFRKKFLGLR